MSFQRKGRAKYHGLVNQGATCFLNSVLQVLFMTDEFRDRVKRYCSTNTGTEHIDTELNDLFWTLERNCAQTHRIIDKLGIHDVYKQRDATEHYEKILRLTSPGASQIFHGELINKNTCQNCAKVTPSAVGFWQLPLPLVNDNNEYSVEKGIEDFFCPSVISGEDQMYCETCDKKCDAVLECEVKHYPEVLVLLLKRFEMIYDGNYMRKVKIHCPVKMPDTLHMGKIRYELYAFVEHFGDLNYGHYNAKIKSPDEGRWYIFDDRNVKESDYQHFQLDPTETSENVYLLFYQQRKAKARPHTWETLPATVPSGTKNLQEEEEEEEEEHTATRGSSQGYGAKGKPGRASLKRAASSEDRDLEVQRSDLRYSNDRSKETTSVKQNKKHEPRQDKKQFRVDANPHVDSVLIKMPADSCEERRDRIKRQKQDGLSEYDGAEWGGGALRREQSKHGGHQSGQTRPGKSKEAPQNDHAFSESRKKDDPAVNRNGPVRGSSRTMHGNVTEYRMRSDEGTPYTYPSQDYQLENFRGEMERTEKERRGSHKGNYKGKVGRESYIQERPQLHKTPQQCLESQRKMRTYGYSPGRGGGAADHKSKAKKSTQYSPQNESFRKQTHGRENPETEITPLDEECNTTLYKTQGTRDCRPKVRGDTNVQKNKKRKSSWGKWFSGCLPFKWKRSK